MTGGGTQAGAAVPSSIGNHAPLGSGPGIGPP
jgi:hypothetical protein